MALARSPVDGITYEFECSETLAVDVNWGLAEMEEAERRSEDEEGGREDNKNRLFKGQSEIKALAAFMADDGPKGIISCESAAWRRGVEIHFCQQ